MDIFIHPSFPLGFGAMYSHLSVPRMQL
uniref:Uncharacterized protein n=1 Tax=Rhizophora mucronata TaxID=61149 RepID=A0A2P2PZX1_RHIMU